MVFQIRHLAVHIHSDPNGRTRLASKGETCSDQDPLLGESAVCILTQHPRRLSFTEPHGWYPPSCPGLACGEKGDRRTYGACQL